MFRKIGIAITSGIAFVATSALCFADYATTSFSLAVAQADMIQLATDVGVMIGLTVGLVLGIAIGLLGIGYAYRKFKGKITGKKF